jgi:hypothetical protein
VENVVTLAGLSLLVITGIRLWRRPIRGASRLDVFMMLLGGFTLNTGLVGDGLRAGAERAGEAINSGTALLFGVGLPMLLVVAMAALIIIDVKDRTIWPGTPFVAACLATVANVVGGMSTKSGVAVLEALGKLLTFVVDVLSLGWVA